MDRADPATFGNQPVACTTKGDTVAPLRHGCLSTTTIGAARPRSPHRAVNAPTFEFGQFAPIASGRLDARMHCREPT